MLYSSVYDLFALIGRKALSLSLSNICKVVYIVCSDLHNLCIALFFLVYMYIYLVNLFNGLFTL